MSTTSSTTIDSYLGQLQLPETFSHKGQNGKVMVIGGSELFHAASRWSLDMVSRVVDMVFYTSVPSNNELIKEAKGEFWDGIVIERNHLEEDMGLRANERLACQARIREGEVCATW